MSRLSLSVMSALALLSATRSSSLASSSTKARAVLVELEAEQVSAHRPLGGAADEQVAGESSPSPSPSTKPMPPGGTAHFHENSGSEKWAIGSVVSSRRLTSAAVSAMFVGGQRSCCSERPPNVDSISRNCATRSIGPMSWTQPPFIPRSTRLISSNVSSPFSCSHRSPLTGSNAMPKLLRIRARTPS